MYNTKIFYATLTQSGDLNLPTRAHTCIYMYPGTDTRREKKMTVEKNLQVSCETEVTTLSACTNSKTNKCKQPPPLMLEITAYARGDITLLL